MAGLIRAVTGRTAGLFRALTRPIHSRGKDEGGERAMTSEAEVPAEATEQAPSEEEPSGEPAVEQPAETSEEAPTEEAPSEAPGETNG
jgi:hypothetical protein